MLAEELIRLSISLETGRAKIGPVPASRRGEEKETVRRRGVSSRGTSDSLLAGARIGVVGFDVLCGWEMLGSKVSHSKLEMNSS